MTQIKVYQGTHPDAVVKKAMAEAQAADCYVDSFQTAIDQGRYILTVLLVKKGAFNE